MANATATAAAAALDLTPAELAALMIVAKPFDKQRDRLAECTTHPVDLTVRLRGIVAVGAPAPRTVKSRPTPAELLACVLDQLGPKKRADVAHAAIARLEAWQGDELETSAEARQLGADLVAAATREQIETTRPAVTGTVAVELIGRREQG